MMRRPTPAPSTCPRCATDVLAACTDERARRAIAILASARDHLATRQPIPDELYWQAMNLALEFPGWGEAIDSELAIEPASDTLIVTTRSVDLAAAALFAGLTHDLEHLRTRAEVRSLSTRARTYTDTQYRRDATQIALAAHAIPAHRTRTLLNLAPTPIAEYRRDAGQQTPSAWITHTLRTIGAEPAVMGLMGHLH